MLSELTFYEELSVVKTDHAFKGYAMSCKVELVEKKGSIKQVIQALNNDLMIF